MVLLVCTRSFFDGHVTDRQVKEETKDNTECLTPFFTGTNSYTVYLTDESCV